MHWYLLPLKLRAGFLQALDELSSIEDVYGDWPEVMQIANDFEKQYKKYRVDGGPEHYSFSQERKLR